MKFNDCVSDRFNVDATNKYEFELLFLSHVLAGIIPPNVCCGEFHDNYNSLTCYSVSGFLRLRTQRGRKAERKRELRDGKSIYDLSFGLE